MANISEMRTSFDKNSVIELEEFSESPFVQFDVWFSEARSEKRISEPNAFVLSTANQSGRVRSRSVLLKLYDETGFVFFTNYGSQKAHDLSENNQASMLFPWFYQQRQLIVEGSVEKVSQAESLKYFLSRPRGSQIGAWVSEQSKVINSRQLLIEKTKQFAKDFLNKDVPLPDFWGGYKIKPNRFEFWQGQPDRLHDRVEYTCNNNHWQKQLLAP